MHPGVYLPHNRGVLVVAAVTGSKASASPELLSQYIHLYIYINIYITLDWGTKVMRTKLALSTELRPASPVDPCLWATSRVCLRRGQHTSYSSLGCVIREAPLMDHFNSTDTTFHSFPASPLSSRLQLLPVQKPVTAYWHLLLASYQQGYSQTYVMTASRVGVVLPKDVTALRLCTRYLSIPSELCHNRPIFS